MRAGSEGDGGEHTRHAAWYRTLWLTGVDYFSSLGYAPGLAYLAAGYMAPIATLLLVAVTFFAAVPVYALVAKYSPHGEGSIKMIEQLTLSWGRLGWFGKALVLGLLGFAMTGFVITITLSSADATVHVLENTLLVGTQDVELWNPELITASFIVALGLVFLKSIKEAIGFAVLIGVPYMILNAIIIADGLMELAARPELVAAWWSKVVHFDVNELRAVLQRVEGEQSRNPLDFVRSGGFGGVIVVTLLVFPKLALGLSGFETCVSVMPFISGKTEEIRIRNTRKMLVTAASLMSVELVGSSVVTSLLIPVEEFAAGGRANGRALAFLAHEHLGEVFGTIYDLNTLAILWFAGASAMAGLLNIIPRYLPRFGMSPGWIEYRRPLVIVITLVCLVVSSLFDADVEKQGAAYATGVLALMSSGALAVLLAEWQTPRRRYAFLIILGVFAYVLVVNSVQRPEGLRIAGFFILATIVASIWSRWRRASEIRVQGFAFVDEESKRLWAHLRASGELVLIPLRSCDEGSRRNTIARSLLHLEVERKTIPCFLHIELTEDPSSFSSPIKLKVSQLGDDYLIEVQNAVAVANAIAYVALELRADEVVIGLLDSGTPVVNAVLYLMFGTGEVGYAVRAIFMRLRESRLQAELERRRSFDRDRDTQEREALRAMIFAEKEDREKLAAELFAREQAAFQSVMTSEDKLPRLILVG